MRLFITVMLLMIVSMTPREIAVPAVASENVQRISALYEPNPAHIWNRLYDVLLIREDPAGAKYGEDSLDPLLWLNTEHLLAQSSHQRAMRVLDEFLQKHAENQIHDPVKRAILQRDLWAVFDWSVQQYSVSQRPPYNEEKRELQTRLAEVLHRLALSPKEIEMLPDNYAQAVAAGTFAKEYDPQHSDRAFLPPDLFDPRGPWVYINGVPEATDSGGVAQAHVQAFSGRSRFLVCARSPYNKRTMEAGLWGIWGFRPDAKSVSYVLST